MDIIRRKQNEASFFNPFEDLEKDFHRILNTLWVGKEPEKAFAKGTVAIDVEDKGDRFLVEADLPGLKKEDLKVQVDGDIVTIRAERKREEKEERKGSYYYERSYGAFERSFRLAGEVDAKGVKASLKNGVLKLELPKVKTTEAKQIDIKIEE